jgi:drug/metabolite transporter (DMT)-like permease
MTSPVWLFYVLMTIVLWSATSLLYKAGARGEPEEHICLKFSVSVGMVFFVIAIAFLIMREEPFSIWESAAKFWPMTLFGPIYAIVNTISYKGYVHNEATVQSPVEGISGGTSTVLLIIAYLVLGRVDSVSRLLTPLRTAGILIILVSIILLSVVRNRERRINAPDQEAKWMSRGLGTLIFPVLFAVIDALETIVSGICLDTTYGYGMPEGDSIIIVGMEYAVFALGCWIYIWCKEKKVYNPFTRRNAPRILGAVADNAAIVFYSYAMAMNSVSTDPILAVYPILVMIGGRVFMKEKVSTPQYIFLIGIVVGSIMVIAGTL